MVTIDYNRSLADMVKVGKYGSINKNITAKNFPVTGTGRVNVEVVLVPFHQKIKSNDALTKLDKLRFRSAIISELLAFGEMHPKLQPKFPIVALGSIANIGNNSFVPYLDCWVEKERDLDLLPFERKWGYDFLFAAVRK